MAENPAGQQYRPNPDQQELTRKIHASEAAKGDERSYQERAGEAISWLNGDEFESEKDTNARNTRLKAATDWLEAMGR